MIEEQAIVVKADDQFAWVETSSSGACGHCAARNGCGTASLQRWLNRHPNRLQVENNCAVNTGDQVIVGIPEHALLKGSFLIYMLPLLTLILSAMLGVWLHQLFGWWSRDALSIVFGFTGLIASFLFLRVYILKRTTRKDWRPVIVRLAPQYPFEKIVESRI